MYKRKYITTLLDDNYLNNFNLEYPKFKSVDVKKLHKDIMSTFTDIVVSNPQGARLPNQLGTFYLGLLDRLKHPRIVDSFKSKIEKSVVKFFNFHSNRKPGKLIWSVDYARHANSAIPYLLFSECSTFRRKAAKEFLENGKNKLDTKYKKKLIK